MRAAILAIGTEITSGQIVNRNPSWLSERLETLGVEVTLHLSVADTWKEMLWGLDRCAEKADLIFTTGGLGPTSDDFTRDVAAEWAGRNLFFHEPSLEKIRETMARLKRNMVESQKRQCYYPMGAAVLVNRVGTANGFSLEAKGKKVWILPGPPREVAAIWTDYIEPSLQQLVPSEGRKHLFSWSCLGKPEAELAEIVELAVKGSELQTGYRLHAPYVEVKLWCEENQVEQQARWIRKVEDAIKPWLALHKGEDVAERFLRQVRRVQKPVHIYDYGTKGYLGERLGAMIRESVEAPAAQSSVVTISVETFFDISSYEAHASEARPRDGEIGLYISPLAKDRSWTTEIVWGIDTKKSESFESPMPPTSFNEKNRLMASELSLKIWADWLSTIFS